MSHVDPLVDPVVTGDAAPPRLTPPDPVVIPGAVLISVELAALLSAIQPVSDRSATLGLITVARIVWLAASTGCRTLVSPTRGPVTSTMSALMLLCSLASIKFARL